MDYDYKFEMIKRLVDDSRITRTVSKEEYNKTNAWGLSTSIDLFDCDSEILRDRDKIKEFVIELCKIIDMKRFLEPVIVRFGADPKVQGYSLMQLIETSSITGHFAEESNSVYIDIFSCKFYDQKEAAEFTKRFFKAGNVRLNVVIRGVMGADS